MDNMLKAFGAVFFGGVAGSILRLLMSGDMQWLIAIAVLGVLGMFFTLLRGQGK